MKKKILILEDELTPLNFFNDFLNKQGFSVYNFKELDLNISFFKEDLIDLVIVNAVKISENTKDQLVGLEGLPFIFLGNESNLAFKLDASLKLVLSLPVTPNLLLKTIFNLLEEKKRRENWAYEAIQMKRLFSNEEKAGNPSNKRITL